MKGAMIFASILLSGCSSLVERGREANDTAVDAAEFTICYGASVGAIRRSYGDRPQIWLDLCSSIDDWVIE